MSIRLLQDPERLHDVGDDVESVYWVLIHEALKRFALPRQFVAKDIFDQQTTDEQGRCVGGQSKRLAIVYGELLSLGLSSKALDALVHECTTCWHRFHTALRPDDYPLTEGQKNMLVLAPTPSFWLERFASVLVNEAFWSNTTTAGGLRGVDESNLCPSSGRKRGACEVDGGPESSNRSTELPRRSKRLKRFHKLSMDLHRQ